MTSVLIHLGGVMLALYNLEKVHSDAQLATVQISWSIMCLSNAYKEEMLLIELHVIFGARYPQEDRGITSVTDEQLV